MADSKTLVRLIEILEPLASDDRHRNINAALTFLKDPGMTALGTLAGQQQLPSDGGGITHHAPEVSKRLRQHNIPADQIDSVLHFNEDGSFGIVAVPGKSKREQALNAYVLVGFGTYLTTGKYDFTDSAAREACKAHNAYDSPNHSKTLGQKHPAFIAKGSDWTLTIPGVKEAAALVKEVAEAAAKS